MPNPTETLDYFIKQCKQNNVQRILDIGAGTGRHTAQMRSAGLNAETNDILPSDHQCFYHDLIDLQGFDGIWASHVLEHQLNPGDFLRKIHNDLREGGMLAITVPPRKDHIVGGHVTLWNAGLLLYNLILAGFDCSDAAVATYHYNISVVVRKKTIEQLPELHYDSGDIDLLKSYFPKGLDIKEGFNGIILCHNWDVRRAGSLPPPLFAKTIEK